MKSSIRAWVLASSLLAPVGAQAQAPGYRIDGAEGGAMLQLRAGPGPGYPVVGPVPPLTPVSLDRCERVASLGYSWCRVGFGRSAGWLSAKFLIHQTTGMRPGINPQAQNEPTQIRVPAIAPTPPRAIQRPRTQVPMQPVQPARPVQPIQPAQPAPPPVKTALYRVVKVESWDKLNIRSGPHHTTGIVGSIPAHGEGIRRLDCAKGGKWCRIDYLGATGWVSAYYLKRM